MPTTNIGSIFATCSDSRNRKIATVAPLPLATNFPSLMSLQPSPYNIQNKHHRPPTTQASVTLHCFALSYVASRVARKSAFAHLPALPQQAHSRKSVAMKTIPPPAVGALSYFHSKQSIFLWIRKPCPVSLLYYNSSNTYS